jgi:hypothetical protein
MGLALNDLKNVISEVLVRVVLRRENFSLLPLIFREEDAGDPVLPF